MILQNCKSPGPDGLVNEMFKNSNDILHQCLCDLFNVILKTGTFPSSWGKGIIYPLHKKGPLTEVNNFRGISLLSSMSKIFTKIINNRLVSWADEALVINEA